MKTSFLKDRCPISEANWIIDISNNLWTGYSWIAKTEDFVPIKDGKLEEGYMHSNVDTCKEFWEEFAKMNNIKHWSYGELAP